SSSRSSYSAIPGLLFVVGSLGLLSSEEVLRSDTSGPPLREASAASPEAGPRRSRDARAAWAAGWPGSAPAGPACRRPARRWCGCPSGPSSDLVFEPFFVLLQAFDGPLGLDGLPLQALDGLP